MSKVYGYEMISPNGAPKKKRFSSGRVMRTIYENMTTDDMLDAKRRSKIRKVYDGFLPYDRSKLERSGIKAVTNVNFLGLRGIIEARATNILRLSQDTTPLVELQPLAKELAGPDATKIAQVIADEFSTILREDGKFIPALAMMNKEADLYGLGPITWSSPTDFVPLALQRGQIRFVTTAVINSSDNDLYMFETTCPASYLFYLLENEDIAKEQGWDVPAVKRLVVASFYRDQETSNLPDNESSTTYCEEALSRMRRNGTFETLQFEEVKLINAFVKELEAPYSISHYVIPGKSVDENDDNSFLYVKHNAYETMDQCFLWMPYTVTERYAKEVRGLATYILPIEDVKNRIHCALCDATIRASSFILNRKSQGKVSDLSITETGPYTVIDADLTPVQQQVAPHLQDIQAMAKAMTDLEVSTVTGMNELPIVRDDKAYSPSARETKAMVMQQQDSQARHEEALFVQRMHVLDKLFQECFRRFIELVRKPSEAQYYPAVKTFLKRCEMRRLDKKTVLEAYDKFTIRTCRDLIIGSEGKVSFLKDLLGTLGGTLDEQGRKAAVRDVVELRLGLKSAERYTAEVDRDQEPSDSASFATQENNAINNGLPTLVGPDQLHWSHIPIHVQIIQQISDQVEQGQIEDPQKALQVLDLASTHVQEHLKYGEQQIGKQDDAKQVKAVLRGIVNITKALNLLVKRQEAVQQAEREKAERERADLEKRASENELNAAKYKVDREAELAKYKEDKLHEARMAGIQMRNQESEAKSQLTAQKLANDAEIRRAESEEKMRLAREDAANMAVRLNQRSNIAGSAAPKPLTIMAPTNDTGLASPYSI